MSLRLDWRDPHIFYGRFHGDAATLRLLRYSRDAVRGPHFRRCVEHIASLANRLPHDERLQNIQPRARGALRGGRLVHCSVIPH